MPTSGTFRRLAIVAACLLTASCTTVVHQNFRASEAGLPSLASSISVRDTGAKGDGSTDDTAAFQAALDSASHEGRGGTVFVPLGNYLIKTHLDIPANVTLEGIWTVPTAWTEHKGSTLLAVEGEGNPDGTPFLTLHTNSVIKGLTVFYPDQVAADPPKAYPWTIASAGSDNASIVDVLLVNPYQAVDFGTHPAGRHYIRNLYGMPLYKGIFVDQCYDIGRIENVHFWPFWHPGDEKKAAALRRFIAHNGEPFIFARTDWEYVVDTFSWGYRVGYHFIKSKAGYCNGNFLGIGADATEIAVQVDECAPYGLLITNGEFVSFNGNDPTAIVVGRKNIGTVQFQNCAFWGGMARAARIHGVGTAMFNGCNFVEWDAKGRGDAAIDAAGGNLVVTGCNFQRPGPDILLEKGLESATITGNRFGGPINIVNRSGGAVKTSANVGLKPPKEEEDAIVIDDSTGAPEFTTEGKWSTGMGGGDYLGATHWAFKGDGADKAVWRPRIEKTGRYTVYVWYGGDPVNDHATDAPYTIQSSDGEKTVHVDLKKNTMQWNPLGEFRFDAGTAGSVTTSNNANGQVVADAVKFVPAR